MLKQNKKDKQDRHRWLLIGFLCLFGVCLVAQVRPTEPRLNSMDSTMKGDKDTSKVTQTEDRQKQKKKINKEKQQKIL